ncbi:LacI family DNA-binding transcriptional regulator [Afifella aestuarii]|uniref:LacI family DNA-binding transcriptional regulator n=1 Tax=Afifella aestuarii TaxID=1909496 RepID=UPI000FE3E28C|nr:LacI family DNA-binding transcriptional regulator [Afifella aestuarii]
MSISIKDVAEKAGVSVATVSRVLSEGPVRADTKERVHAAIKALGYRPNLSARRLRTQHAQTIGLIVSDIRNPFFTAVGRGVEDAAYRAGMRVLLCNTDENVERERMYLRLMQEERVTGLILAPTLAMLDQLQKSPLQFPAVLIDRAGAGGLYDSVVLDNREAANTLVEHLFDEGYRRIGGVFGQTSATGLERRDGYCASMKARGLTPDPRLLPPTVDAGERAMSEWLSGPDAPEAIIASNGLLLMGVVKAAQRLGRAIPSDLAVAGFDNEHWTEVVGPGLTVIEQPVHDIGRNAMSLLFDRLQNPGLAPRKVVLSGRCIVRGSTLASKPAALAENGSAPLVAADAMNP